MKIKSVLLGCVAVSAMGTFAAPAFAETAPAASNTGLSGDIVVTARRKEETLQSVPISITALSQDALTERSVTSAQDLPRLATGLVVTADSGNPGQPTFSIRGRGQVYGAATGSVETYFAELPMSSTFQMPAPPPQFFDVSNIQVLKGPQGTLFGRNTTGGAVVVVPQAPKLGVTEGYVRVQGGTYDDFQIEGAINLPLGEKFALRLAAFDWQRTGYENSSATDFVTGDPQTDVTSGAVIGGQNFNNVNTTQFRASLLAKPTDGIENTTVISYLVDKTRTASGLNLARTSTTTAVISPRCGTYCAYIDVNLYKPASKYFILANTTKVELMDGLKLKNIFGFIDSTGYGNVATSALGATNVVVPAAGAILAQLQNAYQDSNPHSYGVYIDGALIGRAQKNQQFTDELQLQGNTSDHKLSYTIGAMYDKTSQPHGVNDINFFSTSFSGLFTGFQNAVNFQSSDVLSKAVYATGSYSPIEKLNITAGFRQTWVDLTQYGAAAAYAVGDTQPLSPQTPITAFSGAYKGSTYNIGADYHIDNATMVYAGYRHGWKRGGLNPSSEGSLFAPELVDDFSLGVKSKFRISDVPVRFNMELFYDPYTGLQTSSLTVGSGQLETVTINVPKTRYQGFDADIWARPAAWLDLSASWSYNDAKFTRWDDPLVGALNPLTSNHVPYVSKNKVQASTRVHTELGNNVGEVVWLTSYNYQSTNYTSPFNTVLGVVTQGLFGMTAPATSICAGGVCGNTIPGYATVDMRLELNHAFGSKFDLAAGVTNLTNKFFLLGSGATLDLGAEGYAVGAPRMWTFEVKTRF